MKHIGSARGRIASLFAALLVMGCGEVTSVSPDAAGERSDDGGGADAASGSGDADADADADDDGGADLGCPADHSCLGAVPSGWEGPVALGDDSSCPSSYPDVGDPIHEGLNAPDAVCGCGCFVSDIDCRLIASNEQGGGRFEPESSCESPPVDNACLTVDAVGSCDTNASSQVPNATWDAVAPVCSGATAGDSCEGGSCYPSPGDGGPLCIVRDGDHACPDDSGFTERTLYHRSFSDTRACSPCSCQAVGQVCEKDIEICSVGFEQVTLSSDGDERCLNSSDGEQVTLFTQRVTDSGICTTSGGDRTGSASPTEPVTVCCTP